MGEHNELVYRAVDLITAVSSDETIEFEMEVLKCSAFETCTGHARGGVTHARIIPSDCHQLSRPQIGSERNKKAAARLVELSSTNATWQSKFAEGMGIWNVMFALWGLFGPLDPEHAERSIYPNPSWDHIAEAFDVSLKGCTLLMEAQAMADDSDIPFMALPLEIVTHLRCARVSHLEKWQPKNLAE